MEHFTCALGMQARKQDRMQARKQDRMQARKQDRKTEIKLWSTAYLLSAVGVIASPL